MIVSNHFDVRWVDGYSAVSDVPSSLAAMIEKLAAELPSSGDRIELAVRDVQRPDGTLAWVGLLRFVVAVSSAPRPLGFLHAAVLPGSYRLDLDGWRSLVARRYGAHPEDRIRTLYEELAESTKDIGRDRLHALAIRPEDVRELLDPVEDGELAAGLPRAHARPGSRPPKNAYPRPASAPGSAPVAAPAAAPGPKLRPSQPILPLSMQVINLPDPQTTEEMPGLGDLANDITQPMSAPSGTVAPVSGEHPRRRLTEERGQRAWWALGAALGTLVVLLGAVSWLGHRHMVLLDEYDRCKDELVKRPPDWERDRVEIERLRRELDLRTAAEKKCSAQVETATQECKDSLNDARNLARIRGDRVDKLEEAARLSAADLQDTKSNLAKLKNDLTAANAGKGNTEQRLRDLEAENKRLQGKAAAQEEQLSALTKCLQSARSGKPGPKECQGIK